MKGIYKGARFLRKTWKEFSEEPRSCKKAERNFEKSQLLLQEVRFPEKTPKEFAKELASFQKHQRNCQERWLPGKSAASFRNSCRVFRRLLGLVRMSLIHNAINRNATAILMP